MSAAPVVEADEPPYRPGDLVQNGDADEAERGTAVVLRVLDERADEHEFEPGRTVADVNRGHPADDLVVEVAFEGWLDSNVVEWRGLLDDARTHDDRSFYGLLSAYAREWGVPKRVYAYPASRLDARPWCYTCGERAEWVPGVERSGERDRAGGGYACANPDCADPEVVTDDVRNADDEAASVADEDGEVDA